MVVICDSSSLIALIRINSLEILRKIFTEIFIPNAVYEDLTIKGMGKAGITEIETASWIKKQKARDKELVKKLNTILHLGECEAIVLAKELKADFLILDDKEARSFAKKDGLNAIGLLAVLLRAKELGVIKELKPILNNLRRNDFFMDESLYREILQKANEI